MKQHIKDIAIGAALVLLFVGATAVAANDVKWNQNTNASGQSVISPAVSVPIAFPMSYSYVSSATATTTAGTLATSSVYTSPMGPTSTQALTYYVEVSAVDSFGGTTVPGNELFATPSSTTSTNEIVVSWGAVSGASSYNVYVGTASGAENRATSTTNTSFTLATTTTLVAGTPPTVNTAYATVLSPNGNVTLGGNTTLSGNTTLTGTATIGSSTVVSGNVKSNGLTVGTTTLPFGYLGNVVGSASFANGGTQFNLQNNVSSSYSCYTLTADNGTPTTNFGTICINNSGLTDGIQQPNDLTIDSYSTTGGTEIDMGTSSEQFIIGGISSSTTASMVKLNISSSSVSSSVPVYIQGYALPAIRVATATFPNTVFGSELLSTSSVASQVAFPYAGFAAGDACTIGLSTAPTGTPFFESAQIMTSTATTATATVSYWSDATTAVTVATGTQKVTCYH